MSPASRASTPFASRHSPPMRAQPAEPASTHLGGASARRARRTRARIGGGHHHYWALNTQGDPTTERWWMQDLFTLYGAAIRAGQGTADWEDLVGEANSNPAFTAGQRLHLQDTGEAYGVDTNLAP